MPRTLLHTITESDIGKPFHTILGYRTDNIHWGNALPTDIDKRIYRVNGIFQIENSTQRNTRLSEPKP